MPETNDNTPQGLESAQDAVKSEDTPTVSRSVTMEVQRAEGDGESTLRATVSTEAEVPEYVYYNDTFQLAYRILDHGKGSVDMTRVKDGMPVTDQHYGDQVALAKVSLTERKLTADGIEFASSQRAQDIGADARKGIRRNLSVHGIVDESSYQVEGDRDGIPVIRAMRWMPLYVAFVVQQADLKAGIGREHNPKNGGNKMPEAEAPKAPQNTPQGPTEETARAVEAEKQRTKDVQSIYELARFHNIEPEVTREVVEKGTTLREFQSQVMTIVAKRSEEEDDSTGQIDRHVAPPAGMSEKEVKQYSLIRAISSMDPQSPQSRQNSLEREVSDEVAKLYGKPAQGMYIPAEVACRDLTTLGTGGNLVDTSLLSGSMIEKLRSNLVLTRLGIRTLGGLVGDIAIPKQTGAGTGYWVSENGAPTESQQTLKQLAARPHTAGAMTDISRRMLKQSSLDAESFVQTDLSEVMARLLQTAAIAGTGADGQPLGLVYADGLNEPTISTPGTPTWQEILTFPGMIMADNITPENAGWLIRPLVWSKLAGTDKSTSTGQFIADTNTKTIAGYGYEVTTGGLPSKAGIFGIWSELVMAMWGTMDITVDPYKHSDTGGLRVVLLQDVDIMVRNGEAFSYADDILA